MLRWLKKLLARGEDGVEIDLRQPAGSTVRATAERAVGLRLQVRRPDGDVLLISEASVVDPDRFFTLWKRLGGREMGLRWEDGTPFEPGDMT